MECIINNIQLWASSRVDLRACFLLCVPLKLPVMDLLGSKTVRAGTMSSLFILLVFSEPNTVPGILIRYSSISVLLWMLNTGCLFLLFLFVPFKITVTNVNMSKHFFLMFSHPFLIHTNIGAYLELLPMSCNIPSILHQRKQ